MKIILSVDAIRFPLTGIGRYTLELARALPAVQGVDELRYFSGAGFVPTLPAGDHVATLQGAKRQLARFKIVQRAHSILYHARRARALRGLGDHVFHGPNFYLPRFSGPSVVTFHDLSALTLSHLHPPERIAYLGREIAMSMRRADYVITDSEYTRGEVIDYFKLPAAKVRAVALASSPDFRPRDAASISQTLGELGLSFGGYVLFAGTMEPRKNLVALLDAYGMIPADLRKRYPLILVGYKGWRNEQIMERVAKAEREGWCRYLGFVRDGDLPKLYSGAGLFVYPSLYEGFGLPVLEAMASGIPVVCSTSSSLPEVAGGAALMSAPEDVDALARHIERGLTDGHWREDATRKGLARAQAFSWARCATETVEVYRAAAGL